MKLRIALVLFSFLIFSQNKKDELIYDIISNVSQERLKSDVQKKARGLLVKYLKK